MLIMPELVSTGAALTILTFLCCPHFSALLRMFAAECRRVDDVVSTVVGIIVLTLWWRRSDGGAQAGSEGRTAGQDQDAERAPRNGGRCAVRILGVLRRCGPGAGQVRDLSLIHISEPTRPY